MNKPFVIAFILFGIFISQNPVFAQDDVKSLRGELPIDQETDKVPIDLWQRDREPIARDYVQQPPLIPHSIDNYKISVNTNKCLSCHSWTNYIDANATKISQTHFTDRTEHVLADVAPRRYFCTQCHVPQTDARPLVENTFQPLITIKE